MTREMWSTSNRQGMVRICLSILFICSSAVPFGCGGSSNETVADASAAASAREWARVLEILDRVTPGSAAERDSAALLRGRANAGLGRRQAALEAYATASSKSLAPVDLISISESLQAVGRPTAARIALEAAAGIAPQDRTISDRLARLPVLEGRPARLLAIPDRSATTTFVSASILLDAGLAEPGPILAALLRLDRSEFAALRTPDEVLRLLARTCLKEGDSATARRLLASVDDPKAIETHWILSRAALVEGDFDKARAELALAGDYRRTHEAEHDPSGYAGAASCRECHSEIHDAQQSSLHSKTLTRPDSLARVRLPKGPVADPEEPGVVHRFDREGDSIRLTTKVREESVEALIDYAVGSGHLGTTMLARDPDGGHRSLRLSYYTGGDHWGLTTGFDPHPKRPRDFVGELLSEDAFVRCIGCHSTRFISESAPPGPEIADRGIGCERCHGPGANHLLAMENDFPDPAIARPKHAGPAARFDICVQCHGADGVIPPSDPRFIRFQGAILPYSRCFIESGKKLDCVSCHSPHHDLATKPEHYEARCLACHTSRPDRKAAARLRVEAVAASICKVDSKKGCVGCHMPKVADAMPFTKFTDHHIRIHRPPSSPSEATR
ncbi:MAG: multiheme c-type cytochrome [Isosphaeraceae bacterium]|nr:multiheme c-type cytochrome [Isosphaeraceae bacterium]